MVAFHLTAGNTDDRQALKQMAKQLSGMLVGDKGYISKDLSYWLKREYGIILLTGVKKYESTEVYV